MQITHPSQITAGMTIYKASNSCISRVVAITTPFHKASLPGEFWILANTTGDETTGVLSSLMSLRDAGIVANTYNDHAAFTTEAEAQRHIAPKCQCCGQIINE
jgi:hypothetical protein